MKILEAIKVFGVNKNWALRKRKEYLKQKIMSKKLHWFLKTKARRKLALKIWLWKIDNETDFTKIKRYFKQLNMIVDAMASNKTISWEEQIELAKQFDIRDILDFNKNGFRTCIFHEEDTPSMKYYEKSNTVYCFGCNTWADSIKITQHLFQCDYCEAVKILAKGGTK